MLFVSRKTAWLFVTIDGIGKVGVHWQRIALQSHSDISKRLPDVSPNANSPHASLPNGISQNVKSPNVSSPTHCHFAELDPSAAELAAGSRRKRKFGLAAEKNAASRKQAEKKIKVKPPQKIRLADHITQTDVFS